MKLSSLLLLLGIFGISAAAAFDDTPIGTFTYKGKTLVQAQVIATNKKSVVLMGKNSSESVAVPWDEVEKDLQLRSRVAKELEKHKAKVAAAKELPDARIFKVVAVLPDGLHCVVCKEEYEPTATTAPGTAGTLQPIKKIVETSEAAFVTGYKNQKNIATGETFIVATEPGEVKNLGPAYGGVTLRIQKVIE